VPRRSCLTDCVISVKRINSFTHSTKIFKLPLNFTARVKKQPPVHFTVVSTYVDRFLEYLFGTEYIKKMCNTNVTDLPISPTQCCCITLGKLISRFQLNARWCFFGSMWVALQCMQRGLATRKLSACMSSAWFVTKRKKVLPTFLHQMI